MKLIDKAVIAAGISVAGAAAVVASATTLAFVAKSAGWTGWSPWLLPASLDVGAAVGVWSWLRPGAPEEARGFARGLAVAGSAGTLVGNAVGHLIKSSMLTSGPVLVITVGAVPAAMLVALAHLAALLVATTPNPIVESASNPIGSTIPATTDEAPEAPSVVAVTSQAVEPPLPQIATTTALPPAPVVADLADHRRPVPAATAPAASWRPRQAATVRPQPGPPPPATATQVAAMTEDRQIEWFAAQIADGAEKTAKQWAEATGIKLRTAERRLPRAKERAAAITEQRSDSRQESTA